MHKTNPTLCRLDKCGNSYAMASISANVFTCGYIVKKCITASRMAASSGRETNWETGNMVV